MLKNLRDGKGFTLIELMIVIAIIGILAAIAIPNFISYRNKAFCSAAESDANNIAAGISDYYAIPTHVDPLRPGDYAVNKPTGLGLSLSGDNVASIGGSIDAITISVLDASGRCPQNYQTANDDVWDNTASIAFKRM